MSSDYEGTALAGGTLVIAPLQKLGDEEFDEEYVALLHEELPKALQEHTTFDEVTYGTFAEDPKLLPLSVALKDRQELWTYSSGQGHRPDHDLVRLVGPAPGSTPITFEEVEADYILFVRGIGVYLVGVQAHPYNPKPGPTYEIPSIFEAHTKVDPEAHTKVDPEAHTKGDPEAHTKRDPDVGHRLHFLLWDNQKGQPVMTGGGMYKKKGGMPDEEDAQKDLIDNLGARMLEKSPFRKDN